MPPFWQNLLKNVFLGQNGFILAKDVQNSGFSRNSLILAKAAENYVLWPKWPYFGKGCLRLYVFVQMGLSWQKLLKPVQISPNESKWQTGLNVSKCQTGSNETNRWIGPNKSNDNIAKVVQKSPID